MRTNAMPTGGRQTWKRGPGKRMWTIAAHATAPRQKDGNGVVARRVACAAFVRMEMGVWQAHACHPSRDKKMETGAWLARPPFPSFCHGVGGMRGVHPYGNKRMRTTRVQAPVSIFLSRAGFVRMEMGVWQAHACHPPRDKKMETGAWLAKPTFPSFCHGVGGMRGVRPYGNKRMRTTRVKF